MYTLFYNKDAKIIKVSKANKGMQHEVYLDEIRRHNDCYYTCKTRQPLVDKAKEIKQEWVSEAKSVLDEVRSIKV